MLHLETVAPNTFQLLESISSIQELKGFSLAVGTALALQIGHRISVDLDFCGDREFTTDEIIDSLIDIKPLSIISQNRNILILNKYADGSEMMVARSLTFFEDADTDESPQLLLTNTSWPEVKQTILREVKNLY